MRGEYSIVITNQSGFNFLDKLKDSDGNYILQKDPTLQTKGKLLFGEYQIVKLSKKTLKSTPILAEDGTTMILVTHEIGFAREVATRILFMDGGRIAADGTPEEIIDQPENPRLKQFLNFVNRK